MVIPPLGDFQSLVAWLVLQSSLLWTVSTVTVLFSLLLFEILLVWVCLEIMKQCSTILAVINQKIMKIVILNYQHNFYQSRSSFLLKICLFWYNSRKNFSDTNNIFLNIISLKFYLISIF